MGTGTETKCNTLGDCDPSELLPVTTRYLEESVYDFESSDPMSDEERAEVYKILQECNREQFIFVLSGVIVAHGITISAVVTAESLEVAKKNLLSSKEITTEGFSFANSEVEWEREKQIGKADSRIDSEVIICTVRFPY